MRAKPTFLVIAILAAWPLTSIFAQNAQESRTSGLTIQDVLNLFQHGVPADQLMTLILRNPSDFELSIETIDTLKKAGLPSGVIDAMLKSRRGSTTVISNPPQPRPSDPAGIPPPNIRPNQADAGSITPPLTNDRTINSSEPPAQILAKYPQAKSAQIPPEPWALPARANGTGCPIPNHGKLSEVDLDYETGSSSTSRLGRSGLYCFTVRNANPLYDWSVILNVTEPTGSPFDLLNDAIQTLTKLSTGAASAKPSTPPTPKPGENVVAEKCPDLGGVTQKAAALKQALAGMIPCKDCKDPGGKVTYVSEEKTNKAWQAVPPAFDEFEKAVKLLVSNLPDNPGPSCYSIVQQAESVILDDYPKLRAQYHELAARLARPDIIYYERYLDATDSADITATPSYAGAAANAKTFHLGPSFGILSSSAGFLLTELPARSYSSATAPNPDDATKTQNVLKVDYGAGIRPALAVLLTGNVPQVNSHNFGLGVSAGPVFDISNGKADTSRFGFFGGLSVRLTPWIFLTPGVHVGEFGDFPQGFSHPGQLIPANTGTPMATKRYSARFAFAVTFKLKDLGASTGNGQTKPTTGSPAQPAGDKNQ